MPLGAKDGSAPIINGAVSANWFTNILISIVIGLLGVVGILGYGRFETLEQAVATLQRTTTDTFGEIKTNVMQLSDRQNTNISRIDKLEAWLEKEQAQANDTKERMDKMESQWNAYDLPDYFASQRFAEKGERDAREAERLARKGIKH